MVVAATSRAEDGVPIPQELLGALVELVALFSAALAPNLLVDELVVDRHLELLVLRSLV